MKDLSWLEFTWLTYISDAMYTFKTGKKKGRKELRWKCRCRCGKVLLVNPYFIKYGKTVSCGCKAKAIHRKLVL